MDGSGRGEDLGLEGFQVVDGQTQGLGPLSGADELGQDDFRWGPLAVPAPAAHEIPHEMQVSGPGLMGEFGHVGHFPDVLGRDAHGQGKGKAPGLQRGQGHGQGAEGPGPAQGVVVGFQSVQAQLQVEKFRIGPDPVQ